MTFPYVPLTAVALGIMSATAQVSTPDRGLRTPLPRFAVQDKTFEEALGSLARQSGGKFVIGFEAAEDSGAAQAPRLRFSFQDGTVGQALAAMCTIDRRYLFSEVQPGVIEVRPARERPELRTVLDLPIVSLNLQIREWPSNLFPRLPELVPELGEYLQKKTLEWASRTGRPLPGSAGVTMTTNVSPPAISIQLEHTTVRGVLNSFAAYALQHAADMSSAAVYLAPVGWRADFTPDREAPTDLGGYIRWSAFP